jgi:hypothetical protein
MGLQLRTRRTGHPQLWWLLQFEGRATRHQRRAKPGGANIKPWQEYLSSPGQLADFVH